MKWTRICICLIALSQLTFSQALVNSEIKGRIINASDMSLKIGDIDVPISGNGNFRFQTKMEFPKILDIKCGKMSWSIFLEPGKNVKLEVNASDLSSLKYNGDLISANYCLKKISLLDVGTNDYFNNNWAQIHIQDETKFISIVDSLKRQYLKLLPEYQEKNKNYRGDFVKLLNAEIDFGFNYLIVAYPEIHRKFTGEKIFLSKEGCNYLNASSIDDTTLIHSSAFLKYCRKWIDYNADLLVNANTEQKNYNLKKLDVLPKVLSIVFKNKTLQDYWFSEYLNEHIENTGIANSEKYLKEFDTICTTEVYKKRINELYTSYVNAEKDHIVKLFKTINGFKLNAHIFYPDNINQNEKRPAIVIFYGGGFVLGNPSWAFAKAKHYASKGMIAIAAQYRLSNFKDITPIDAIQDAKDLMFWLRKNADSLKIIDNKIAASGWSVGGQICASLAIFADTSPNSKINTSPNALLLTSPGTSSRGWFTELLNGAKINPSDYSPIDHIRSGLPPTIILQGRGDTLTPLEDVQLFYNKLVAKGNYCEIWIYDKVGHLFTPTYLGDNGWPRPDKEIQKQADLKADKFLTKFGYIKE